MPRRASLSAHGPPHSRPCTHPAAIIPSTAPAPHSPPRSVPAAGPPARTKPRCPQPQAQPRCPRAALTSPLTTGPSTTPRLRTFQQRGLPLGGGSPSRSLIGGSRPGPPGPDMAAAGGARGCTSFQRRPGAGPRPPALPGTRPALRRGQLLLSSGLPSLDCVLGWWEWDWDPVLRPRRPPLCRTQPVTPGCSRASPSSPRSRWSRGGREGRRDGGGRACFPGACEGAVPRCHRSGQPCGAAP